MAGRTRPVVALTTFPNLKSAKHAALFLIDKKLAACVNVIAVHESVYRWKGKICRDNEFLLVIKTTRARAGEIAAAFKKIHPYTCPELIWIEVAGGSKDYLSWLLTSVQPVS